MVKLCDDASVGDVIAFARRLAAHWREQLQRVMSAKNAQQLFESPSVRNLRYQNNHVTSSMLDIPQWLQRKADILKSLEKLVEAFVARFTTLRTKLEASLNRRRITELSRSICTRLRSLFPFIEATGAGVNLVNPAACPPQGWRASILPQPPLNSRRQIATCVPQPSPSLFVSKSAASPSRRHVGRSPPSQAKCSCSCSLVSRLPH